jgi:hypothetical protein
MPEKEFETKPTKPVNAPLRQQIIKLLQEREGNAFVQRLLGKPAPGKSP